MLKKLNLGTQFTIILAFVFVVGIIVSWITLSRAMTRRAEDEVTSRGLILIETMNAVRQYTSEHVNPIVTEKLVDEPEFNPAGIPGFSAREVFEHFRSDPEFENFFYKEATLNPANPRNHVDEFEEEIVQQFRANPDTHEVTGFRTLDGKEVFYIARPMVVGSEACLQCHGNPADAPDNLIRTYGSQGGFGWELNEIQTAQMIYVPASDVFDTARSSVIPAMGVFVVIFTLGILLINYLLRRNVILPVSGLATVAVKVTEGSVKESDLHLEKLEYSAQRGDEVGELSRIFQNMAQQVIKRESDLKQQVQQLRVEIDEVKRSQQVEQITESEYFKTLKEKAGELRSQKDRRQSEG